jgi:phosphatidylserine/phosphatidylglycerophosphate/cardiolipin synthase-like enzyme
VLADLAERSVALRLLHAKEPGSAFRRDFDRYPALLNGLEMILCPRVHLKAVVIDGRSAYLGSANLTGAGLGAKGVDRRNFEGGIVTNDPGLVRPIMDQFDRIWMGAHCRRCGRKRHCASYGDLLQPG